jgi:hypothetical protein
MKIKYFFLWTLLFFMFSINFISATITQKVFFSPFYMESMNQYENNTFNFNIAQNNEVSSAIISFNVMINPSVRFYLYVNGQQCNNPTYYVSSSFASAGLNTITFDCSNVIDHAGDYIIYLSSDKDVGSVIGYIDLSFNDIVKGSVSVHGTEYNNLQQVKIWLQLLDSVGQDVINGVCYANVYSPNNVLYLNYAKMLNLNLDGIYYLDFASPLLEGVYPVVAECFYVAGQVFFYPIAYFLEIGTYDSGTVSDLSLVDGTFMRFKESAVNPVRNISVGFNFTANKICSNISSDLLRGLTVRTVAKFDSVVNDDITLSIWNHTSGSWIDMSNKILEGAVFRDVSNSFSFTNISGTGFVNSSGSNVRIRLKDTSYTDGATSNLDVDYFSISCDMLANSSWQDIKGSSEIHVSFSSGDNTYYEETLCGEGSSSACSEFRYDFSYYNVTWGYLYDRILFVNSYQSDIDEVSYYETSLSQDCTGIIDIVETKNNVSYSIYDNLTFTSGNKDNCIIGIPVVFNSSDREFTVEITQENYMLWEVQRDNDYVKYYKLAIQPSCNLLAYNHGISYDLPITAGIDVSSLYASDPIFLGCYRAMDDIYWFDYYFDLSSDLNVSGIFESYLYNVRLYYEELRWDSQVISGIVGQDLITDVYTLCDGESPDSYSCALLKSPDDFFSSQEGYIVENLTAVNDFNTTVHTVYIYSTPGGIDCSAIMQVIKQNGTSTDIYDDVDFSNGDKDNCKMAIPIDYVIGQYSYNIEIYMENYIYWDIQWARDKVNYWNDTINPYCENVSDYYGVPYILPINSSLEMYRTNEQLYFCYRAMDDIYWWYYFYDDLIAGNFTTVSSIESYHYESEFFWVRILDDFNTVNVFNRNSNQVQTLQEIINLRDSVAERVWNATNRNLTSSESINYTYLVSSIWGWTGTVSGSLLSFFSADVWNYTSRILTFYQDTNYSKVAEYVWTYNNRNLTFYEVNDISPEDVWNYASRNITFTEDKTNYSKVAEYVWFFTERNLTTYPINNLTVEDIWNYYNRSLSQDIPMMVWSYPVRNLTYYPAQEDLTNYTRIAEGVWSYDGNRNLTYYLVNNITAQEIWNWTGRELTFYPTQQDLTNYSQIADYVWAYQDRNLTYYMISNLSADEIWNYVDRNLTYYNLGNNLSASDIWMYVDRNLTYYLVNNISLSASDIWNYGGDRNLSSDIPFDVWSYYNRTLTYYTLNITEIMQMLSEYEFTEIPIPFPPSSNNIQLYSNTLNVTLTIYK